ncbi:MAG: hypothetical protein NC344_05350 [Bacteroidales bacterium]|nr:hypothetical protein [Bacteroidales bacterium]MCM1147248.1 hypothetical protein [Bacteroidales bacterium]MCM1207215.1 hypothetical protein [Bacillota bacterium]MCM1509721.1 hypothetical protein [Clostridium sp.]
MNIKEYISRIGKSRGFGIQSPWAYRFVTEVIGERWPYYAYKDIDRKYPTGKERKYRKLLLRISNFVYPAGMETTDVVTAARNLDTAIDNVTSKGVIIIGGIHADATSVKLWESIKAYDRVGITFDCYDFGICFLDREIHKQHYKLNFF